MKRKITSAVLVSAILCLAAAGCEEQVPLYREDASSSQSSTLETFNLERSSENSSDESSKAESSIDKSSTNESSMDESSSADIQKMPELSGKTLQEAKKIISDIGLIAVIENEYNDTVKKDIVIKQSLTTGTEFKKGDSITVTVSLGKKEEKKPVAVTEIKLNTHEISIKEGKYSSIYATISPSDANDRNFTWYWSDDNIVDVSTDGTIHAKAVGKATITVKTPNGKSDSCEVTVIPLPESEKPLFREGENIVKYDTVPDTDKVYDEIDALCEKYPDILDQEIISRSEKGSSIRCLTLGTGDKKALVVSGIHSRENITINFTMRCIEEFAESYVRDREYWGYDVRELLSEYTLYFVPMCNPDGLDISTAGAEPLIGYDDFDHDAYKLNANGVNLNRNFPFYWYEQYSEQTLSPGDEQYAGDSAASEKETQAIISLCDENDFLWMLDMHIVGGGIYWRDSGNGEVTDDWKLTNALASKCGLQTFENTADMADYSGGLENWFRYSCDRPGLCVELVSNQAANSVDTYRELNGIFERAVDWDNTKFLFLEAMSVI